MKAGLNLHSIRNLIKTEESFLETAQKLKEMGYSYLQYSGAPLEPERIKRVSDATGLPIVLTHVPMDRIIGDTEKLMEDHAFFGCKNIGLGSMPNKTVLDTEAFKKSVEDLNAAGERMQKNGFKFFYHHHHYEFFKLKGENVTAIEYMLKNAPYINFTADTHWIQRGGADVCETLEKMKGKLECVHLKDYKIEYNEETGKFDSNFAPVGEGNLNFKKIVETLKNCGAKYYLVEQDNAAILPDTLDVVKRSIDYIQKEL